MLQNAYLVAKIGADTAENEQHFAEILPIGRRVADRCPGDRAGPGGPRRAGPQHARTRRALGLSRSLPFQRKRDR